MGKSGKKEIYYNYGQNSRLCFVCLFFKMMAKGVRTGDDTSKAFIVKRTTAVVFVNNDHLTAARWQPLEVTTCVCLRQATFCLESVYKTSIRTW